MSRVLVFEEDPDLSALFGLLLEGQGHEVVFAGGAVDARALLALRPVDLILIEVPTSQQDKRNLSSWREFLWEIAPQTPAILCSSEGHVNKMSAVVAGFEGYVAMPFELDDAQAEFARVLAKGPSARRGTNGYSCPRT